MPKPTQKTAHKITKGIARHKNVRYHNDAYLSPASDTKICPVCKKPFANRKKWASRGMWPAIIYCSKACKKNKANPVP